MSNVHLPFVSVYQRMTDFVHTLAYVSVIRNSVTGVLDVKFNISLCRDQSVLQIGENQCYGSLLGNRLVNL